MTRAETIAARLASVRHRIAEAARAAGRAPDSVRLVAVSKKMPVTDIEAALAAGQVDFGENYAQELRDKRTSFPGTLGGFPDSPTADSARAKPELRPHEAATRPAWHFIGPLQSNKVKYVAGNAALIHSVDSVALLDEINQRGAETENACLIQVNLAGESQKRGVAPADVPALLDHVATLAHVRCLGLMLIPPQAAPAVTRPLFAALRALRDQQAAIVRPRVDLRELSMGMSDDFEVAIAEGATLVRVGTAIFGSRPPPPAPAVSPGA